MKISDLKKKSILVLGLGREGQATLNFLRKHFPDKKIGMIDQKAGENYLEKIKDFDVVIKSPSIPYLPEILAAKNAGKIITSATNIFLSNVKGKVIGVTGTKGKSTTAALIYEILNLKGLKVFLIGNIGSPALDFLKQDGKAAIFVYELSSFQLEDLEKSPHIAVITNIYPEHLDHHGNFSLYMEAKSTITKFQTSKDYLIYNQDLPELVNLAENSKAKKIPFSKIDLKTLEKLIPKDALSLLGEFNLLNIVPAVIVGRLLKVSDEKILQALINFRPLPHRLEFVAVASGIKFYNDSLSTIPQATIAALSAFGKKVETLIAGGFDRGIDYSDLGKAIALSSIKTLILFPTTGAKIWQAVLENVNGGTLRVEKFDVNSMSEAVKLAFEKTSKGKICLLSPASSSFNMFKDYEDRGNQFKKLVLSSR